MNTNNESTIPPKTVLIGGVGRNRTSRRRKLYFRAVLLLLLALFMEAVSYFAIALAPRWFGREILRTPVILARQTETITKTLKQNDTALTVFDQQLGWRLRRGASTPIDHINSQGLRSRREYSAVPEEGVIRVAAFGDSFVYCTEVADDDAWPALMEQMLPELEVLNYGVPAYGPGQAYLRFRAEGALLSPDVVLMCISPVSLDRSVNVYRNFLARWQSPRFATKPRFTLDEGGELVLIPNPLQTLADAQKYLTRPKDIIELGENDYWYDAAVFENSLYDYSAAVRLGTSVWTRYRRRFLDPNRPLIGPRNRGVFNELSDAFKIVSRILERFAQDTRELGAIPLVVILPERHSLRRTQQGLGGICDPLVGLCDRIGVPCLDSSLAFRTAGTAADVHAWFVMSHYSPSGNRIIAGWLGDRLEALLPVVAEP